MLEKHKKFAAYWEIIGKPQLEVLTVFRKGWIDVFLDDSSDIPSFDNINYRIKDDPHWELRREWVDDPTIPIEWYYEDDQEWERCEVPIWANDIKYRKAHPTGDKTMPEFKIGDKVKIVKKVTEHPKGMAFIWNDTMDDTIGTTESVSEIHAHSAIKLKNGWWYLPESLELLPKENDMTEQNPRAALIDEYCEDWKVTNEPWKDWQWMGVAEKWTDCKCHPVWVHNIKYRRKPKPISINGFDVPMPISVKPEIGKKYFFPALGVKYFYCQCEWDDDESDNMWLDRHICHLDAESAIIHAKALLSFTSPI